MADEIYIFPLEAAREVGRVGGKALKLGELLRAGFRVPGGFVVTTAAETAPAEALSAIARAAAALPAGMYAVRSSATLEDMAGASMAGQFETYLHRQGAEEIAEAVRRCWESAASPRVRAYLREKKLEEGALRMGVVVQRMIDAQVAGVMFTADPIGGAERVAIDASWGVGEAVVSGRVQPDHFVLEKSTGVVASRQIGSKEVRVTRDGEVATTEAERGRECLTAGMLAELAALAEKVEAHFGAGQDVEWAIDEAGVLYCLQVRAITVRSGDKETRGQGDKESGDDPQRQAILTAIRAELTEVLKRRPGAAWARHNLGETLVHPTPLTWTTLRLYCGSGALGQMYCLAGFQGEPRPVPLQLIGGRIYIDLDQAPWSIFPNLPFRYDIPYLKRHPEAAQEAPTIPTGTFWERLRGNRRISRVLRLLDIDAEHFDQELETKKIPVFRAWVEKLSRLELRSLTVEKWIGLWHARDQISRYAGWLLMPSLIFARACNDLASFLAENCWDEDGPRLAAQLATTAEPDSTLRQNMALFELAHGRLSIDAFLRDFGHRAPGELELANPRYRENPQLVRDLAALLLHAENPAEIHRRQFAAAEAVRLRLLAALPARRHRPFEAKVALVRRYARYREDGKHEWMRGYALLRDLLLDAARRLETPAEELALLTEEELVESLRSGHVPHMVMAEQKRLRAAQARLQLPEVIAAEDVAMLGDAEKAVPVNASQMAAYGLSGGSATGPVRIVLAPNEARALEPGYVLVCPSTDPNWTPLFVNAAAIVLERGGALSHGAVVAREMGKPAVVLADATRIFAEGEVLTVDGTAGEIRRAGAAAEAEAGTESAQRAVNPDDDRLAPAVSPPPESGFERAGARAALWGFLIWGVYLLLLWLVPQSKLWEGTVWVFDLLLWPLIGALGRPAAVAALAAAVAVLTMLAQRLMTDVPRLRAVKQRAAALRKQGLALPLHSPREEAIHAVLGSAQWRVARAGLVPLGVLLGPMIVSFMWLPARVDPANVNPAPGSEVTVTARLDGEFAGTVSLRGEGAKFVPQELPGLRQTLVDLERALGQKGELSPVIAARLAATGKTREVLRADLQAFLARPLPEQAASWRMTLPKDAGVERLTVQAGGSTAMVQVASGEAGPPPLNRVPQANGFSWSEPGAGVIRAVTITAADARKADERTFWRPFAWAGWHWDAGWLGLYLVVYLPAMLLARWVLRVP